MPSTKTFELLAASGIQISSQWRDYFSDRHLESSVEAARDLDSIEATFHVKACTDWIRDNPGNDGIGSYYAMAYRFIMMQVYIVAVAQEVEPTLILEPAPNLVDIQSMMETPSYKGKEYYKEGLGYSS